MKEIKVSYYDVSYDPNSDLGGNHKEVSIGKFTKHDDALEFARGKGAWGSDANVKHVSKTIIIFESYAEATGKAKEDEKAKVLAKLTKRERELLGLT